MNYEKISLFMDFDEAITNTYCIVDNFSLKSKEKDVTNSELFLVYDLMKNLNINNTIIVSDNENRLTYFIKSICEKTKIIKNFEEIENEKIDDNLNNFLIFQSLKPSSYNEKKYGWMEIMDYFCNIKNTNLILQFNYTEKCKNIILNYHQTLLVNEYKVLVVDENILANYYYFENKKQSCPIFGLTKII